MGIALALAAAIGWGSADFLARFAAHRIGAYRTLLYMQVFGLVGLTAYLIPSGTLTRLAAHAGYAPWFWAAVFAAASVFASLALYRSFEVGVLSLVSPIAASYAAVTAALAVLAGATFSVHRAAGMILTLAGVLLAAYVADGTRRAPWRGLPSGVGWALAAAVVFGVGFWLLGVRVTPFLGGVAPVWVSRLLTPLILLVLAPPLRQPVRLPPRSVWGWLAGVGVLDTAAFVAAAFGLRSDQVAVVIVITSLFSTVTVLLARIFLRDRLVLHQWAGIALIFAGVALVSV